MSGAMTPGEQDLQQGLRELAASCHAEASAAVEARLLAAYRAAYQDVAPSRGAGWRPAWPLRSRGWALTVAAVLMVAVGAWLLRQTNRMPQPVENAQLQPASNQPSAARQATTAAAGASAPVGRATKHGRAATHSTSPFCCRPVLSGKEVLARANQGSRLPRTEREQLALMQRGWIPLPYSNPNLSVDQGVVVPVEVPVSVLTSLGLSSGLNPGAPRAVAGGSGTGGTPSMSSGGSRSQPSMIHAQLLLGQDSYVRAIRFPER